MLLTMGGLEITLVWTTVPVTDEVELAPETKGTETSEAGGGRPWPGPLLRGKAGTVPVAKVY